MTPKTYIHGKERGEVEVKRFDVRYKCPALRQHEKERSSIMIRVQSSCWLLNTAGLRAS
jgi:hypothetical protein